jgi:hypothetical protein
VSAPALLECSPAALHGAEAFRRQVVEEARPVVLRGLVAGWPVVKAAAAGGDVYRAYLSRLARTAPVDAFFGAPEIEGRYYYGEGPAGFNFERRRMSFPDALEAVFASDEGKSVYVGSVPTEAYLPGFGAENACALVGPVEPRLWIGGRSDVSCHYDMQDNLACVVGGRRRFTLYSPEHTGDLYVGPLDHTMAGQPVSLAASAKPGEGNFPRFEAVREHAIVVELEPGDALYIPKLWWHRVEGLAPLNTLVNYWWDATKAGADPPYAALLLAMIAFSERPPAERRAWRAFFDHYVFRPERHPLEHLPATQHGMLGPLKSTYGPIRARVMQMLRGA